MEHLVGLVAVAGVFGIPIIAVLTAHHRKLVEMRLKSAQTADHGVLAELQALKHQITELRDTTTKYDMSFDSALQRLESRMGHLESRVSVVEQSPNASQVERRLTSP